jgi:hypothetical protein
MSMRFLLAAYDPSRQTNGSYWAWAHPDIPANLPDTLYDRLLDEDKPAHSADILKLQDPDHCRGGCVGIDRTWCCIYRFLYGGLDRSNRQCFVLVCAFAFRRDLARSDWLEVLTQGPWAELLARGDGGSLVPPPARQWEIDVARLELSTRVRPQLDRHGKQEGIGEKGVRQVACTASDQLSGTELFNCRVHWFPPSDLWTELIVEKKPAVWNSPAPVEVARAAEVRVIDVAPPVQHSPLSSLVNGLPNAIAGLAILALGIIALVLMVPWLNGRWSRQEIIERAGNVQDGSRNDDPGGRASDRGSNETIVRSGNRPPDRQPSIEIRGLNKRIDGLREEIETMREEYSRDREQYSRAIQALEKNVEKLKIQSQPRPLK